MVEMTNDQKLEDLRKKLQKEKEIKAATIKLRDIQRGNDTARATCDATLSQSQARINYLQNEFDKLQLRILESTPKAPRTQIAITLPSLENAPPMMKAGLENHLRSYSDSRPPSSRRRSSSGWDYPEDFLSHRPMSTIDLLKAPTPITTKKVIYKLRELAYKLDVEQKVKDASERLEQLGMSAKDGNAEMNERVVLLRRSLQKYEGLYIPGQEDDTTTTPGTGLRRPMTGTLYVRMSGMIHQSNAPTRNSKPAESMAHIKIDGTFRAKTRMARNSANGIRWNEDFEVPVSKASEIEIAVFDKPEHVLVPIGMYWLKISDLVEELRRKKAEADNNAAWAAANAQDMARIPIVRPTTGPLGDNPVNGVEGIEAWWDLEPIGQINLKFNFVKDVAIRKRPSKLGRQGAVRKRKGEVTEIQGHKFLSQKFFQIMRCALCSELFTGKGSQCEDCKFTCHQKCADKVFIKCISSKAAEDSDETILRHRIPHRFEFFTNLSPTWCSHCGHMLTFSRRHKRCIECPVVAHEGCSDLVPNHCGMPAETANKLVEEIRRRSVGSRIPPTPRRLSKPPSPSEVIVLDAKGALPRPIPLTFHGEKPPIPARPEIRPDQSPFGPDFGQNKLQQQMQQLQLQQQQIQQQHEHEQQQRKLDQQRMYEQQQLQLQLQKQKQQQQQQQQHQQHQRDHTRDHRNGQSNSAMDHVISPQTNTLQLAEFASVMVYTLWHTRPNINGASSNAYNVVPHRMTVPSSAGPAFKKFCLKVLTATQLSSSVILLALKYIQKLLKNNPSIHGQQGSEFRLFTVSLMLANKFLDDNTFTNKTWSEVTGINVKEINVMEMEFLNQVQFSLFVSEAEYLDWLHSLETWLKQQGQTQTQGST